MPSRRSSTKRGVFAEPLAFWVALASLSVGAPLGWLTARTDVPGRGLIRGLVRASFVPAFLGAFAWAMLAGAFVNKLCPGSSSSSRFECPAGRRV